MLVASDADSLVYFGLAVAISNGIVAAGAHLDINVGGWQAGAVYVYVKAEDGSWTQQAKLIASDGDSFDQFGWAVAMHGSTLIVGAPYDDDRGISSGSVYVFEYEDESWTEQAKLTASAGSARDVFGHSLSIHGAWMVIGSFRDDGVGTDSGSAYILERMAGGSWTEQAKLLAGDGEADDWFGLSVEILGDSVAVGSPYRNDRSGAVYLLKWIQGRGLSKQCL